MLVIKNDSTIQPFEIGKLEARLKNLNEGLDLDINNILLRLNFDTRDKISTKELDEILIKRSLDFMLEDNNYSILAGRIYMSRFYKDLGDTITPENYLKNLEFIGAKPILLKSLRNIFNVAPDILNPKNDFKYDYLAATSFVSVYLAKTVVIDPLTDEKTETVIETPQMMFLRVAAYLYNDNIEKVKELYTALSERKISLATPILQNAGLNRSTMISCNLQFLEDDSLTGIHNTLGETAISSAEAAGVGIYIGNLRSRKSVINSSFGQAMGVVRFVKMGNEYALSFNQKGKRPGAFAYYLPIWHKDILDFIELRLPTGADKLRAHDSFLGVCYDDVFMKALEEKKTYHLFCPNTLAKHGIKLYELYGEEFEKAYNKAVEMKLGTPIDATELFLNIARVLPKSGLPYAMFSDNVNRTSNHTNMYGTIKGSNLCIEIMQYTDSKSIANCDLGSINVSTVFDVNLDDKENVEVLVDYSSILSHALNRVIDTNDFSTVKAHETALKQRAIGIGILGLADLFMEYDVSFDSKRATELNRIIAEGLYYGAIKGSVKYGIDFPAIKSMFRFYKDNVHNRYDKGLFEFDEKFYEDKNVSLSLDWKSLSQICKMYGTTNTLFTAYMPTASTSTLHNCISECFIPPVSNYMVRKLLGREIQVVNKYLQRDLKKHGLFTDEIKNLLLLNGYSSLCLSKLINNDSTIEFQNLILHLVNKYKSAYEYSQKTLFQLAVDRQCFIDQSQSLNVYMLDPTDSKIASLYIFAWKNGLKTGSYYFYTKSSLEAGTQLVVSNVEASKPKSSEVECFGCTV